MAIFLTILKIIGIVLLCIIGLILFIILYVLLAPYFFKVQGFVERDKNYRIKVKATTFLHFAQVHVVYDKDNGVNYDATIFGPLLKVFPREQKVKRTRKSKEDTVEQVENNKIGSNTTENSNEDITNVSTQEASEIASNEASDNVKTTLSDSHDDIYDIFDDDSYDYEFVDENKEEVNNEGGTNLFHKFKAKVVYLYEKFIDQFDPRHFVIAVEDKFKSIVEKIKNIKLKADEVLEMINDENNRTFVKKVLSQIKKLLKSMGFNMRGTNMDFSLGSPDVTGKVSGAMALFPPIYDKKVRVMPDFADEELYFDGNVTIKGRIHIVCVLYFVLVIYLDPTGKKLINRFL